MEIQAFKYKMIDYNSCQLSDTEWLFKHKGNRWEYWDAERDVGELVEDLAAHPRVNELIHSMTDISFVVEGGRGASSGNDKRFDWEGWKGRDNTIGQFPARMNVLIKTKTQEHAVKAFRERHGKDAFESLIQIDKQGFVHDYANGNKGSVSTPKVFKGALIVHNHPNNSAFSPADMYTTASTKARGIVATHSKGYRIFEKGQRFDGEGFIKAVKRAEKGGIRGKDINDAVDKFLIRNQKKYGYKFRNVLD